MVVPGDIADGRSRLLIAETFSVPQLTSVLRLSALWQMDELTNNVLNDLAQSSADQCDWMGLLDLSEEHQHPGARRLAIQKLTLIFDELLPGVEQVRLARKYRVERWLRTGLLSLVNRSQFFSDADEQVLGWKTVIKLCHLREQRLKDSINRYSADSRECNRIFDWGSDISAGCACCPRFVASSYATIGLEKEFQDELCIMNDN